jgi:hypothetical protein
MILIYHHWENSTFWAIYFFDRSATFYLVFTFLDFATIIFPHIKVVSLVGNLQPEGPSPYIYVPLWQSGPVIPPDTGFLFVAFHYLQGYGGGILTCLHTWNIKILCATNKDLKEQFRNNFNVKLKYSLFNKTTWYILLKCSPATQINMITELPTTLIICRASMPVAMVTKVVKYVYTRMRMPGALLSNNRRRQGHFQNGGGGGEARKCDYRCKKV